MTKEEIQKALIKANKLGARGIQVVGYIELGSATESPELRLITQQGIDTDASEGAWYD